MKPFIVKAWKTGRRNRTPSLDYRLEPEKVTIGSLRFNHLLPRCCPPSDIWKYASEREAGNKIRVDEKTTAELYRFALDNLRHGAVALCKESPSLWKEIKMGKLDCVCI